jgi:histidinol-phosphate aminotransferase/N-methylhydantoinase B
MRPYALADIGAELVSLAQNESCFPPSPSALAAGREALAMGPLYPDPDWHALRQAIAGVHGLDPQAILCGAGSMELIGALIRAFAGPGDEVLAPEYGYIYLATACQQAGCAYRTAPETDFTVSVDALLAAIRPATRIVFVCNPGNPTGTRLQNTELLRLRAGLPDDVLLVIDQAYGEFDAQDPAAIFTLTGRGDTCVLRSFSKAYGLAGARCGWGVFPPAIGAEVRKLLNPNNIAAVSQAMAAAAMGDAAHMHQTVARTAAIRRAFVTRLEAAGLALPESHTNFVLIPFASTAEAREIDHCLRRHGYLLRPMAGYGLAHCLRATVIAEGPMMEVAGIICAAVVACRAGAPT